jgi:hypothetical protein
MPFVSFRARPVPPHALATALGLACLVGCSGGGGGQVDPPPDDTAGHGGAIAGHGGAGGPGGSGGGGQSGGAATPDAGTDAGMTTTYAIPDGIPEPYAAPTGKLPVKLTFASPDDLSKNFYVLGDRTSVKHTTDGDGMLQVAQGKSAILVYDTKPDQERTDTFESFTATVRFRAARLSDVAFTFATDKARNDGVTVKFSIDHHRDGPPGISDVDGIQFASGCATSLGVLQYAGSQGAPDGVPCRTQANQAYGWTPLVPGPTLYTVKLFVAADKGTSTIRARGEFWDGAELVDGQSVAFSGLMRVNGELAFGALSPASDVFIDELTIGPAERIVEPSVVEAGNAQLWLPPGLAKVKGVMLATPDLKARPGMAHDIALYDHLRRFGQVHGWAVLTGVTTAPELKQALTALATASGHAELSSVPLFAESLLNTLVRQVITDPDLVKRTVAFWANKPHLGGDVNMGTAETWGQWPLLDASIGVPGVFCYSDDLASIAQRQHVTLAYSLGRNRLAEMWTPNGTATPVTNPAPKGDLTLWALTGHSLQTHAVVDSWAFYLPLLQEMIALRTTNGGLPLKPIPRDGVWLGSNEKFFYMMPTKRAPTVAKLGATDDPTQVALAGPGMTLLYQAWHYFDFKQVVGQGRVFVPKPAFWATVPKHGKAGDSRRLELGFDAGFTWKSIEFFDAASATPLVPLATVPAGGTAAYEYKNLTAGVHAFTARVTTPDGVVIMVHPVSAVFVP